MNPIKVGIVGLGHIGKRHKTIIESDDRFELVGICDPYIDESPMQYKSLDTMLDQCNPQLVSVCTPNYLHHSIAVSALEDGRHVLCEKPITINKSDAESMLNAALTQSKYLFCVMQNRYSPISQWLKELVNGNILGDILLVNVSCYWNRDDRYYGPSDWKGSLAKDGGTLFTQFAHYVDTLYWLLGELDVTSAQFANFNHKDSIEFEDSGNFQFSFGDGGIGNFQYTTATFGGNFESTLTIVGEQGTIKVGGQYMDQIIHCDIDNYEMPTLESRTNQDNMALVYDNIYNVLTNKDTIMTNALDGMKVVDIIESIYKLR